MLTRLVVASIVAIEVILVIGIGVVTAPITKYPIEYKTKKTTEAITEKIPIEEMITKESIKAGVNPNTALRIAKCESSLNPEAKNKYSTATGLYQFLDSTWKNIGAEAAGLDRTNPKHSIDMFLKYYPANPGWWQCR